MKTKSRFSLLVLTTVIFVCSSGFARSGAAANNHAATSENLSATSWHYRIAPYLWLINMDGSSQIGMTRGHIEQNFGDILSHLSFAGMVWLEADKGNLGIFLNSMYSVLKDTAHSGALTLDATSRFGLFTGGVSYKTYQSTYWSVVPFIGFRYTLNDSQLKASIPSVTVNEKDNQSWVDPLIGLRIIYAFNKAWSATLEGDVGGTSTTTDYSYNVNALIGYHPQTTKLNTTVYLGYRLLDQNYQTGSGVNTFVWNMRIAGPIMGVAFDF